MRQNSGALYSLQGRFPKSREIGLRRFGQAAQQALDIARDNRQHIVEVVRNSAGELTERFEPLRLAEPLLCGPPFGQIAGDFGEAENLTAGIVVGVVIPTRPE